MLDRNILILFILTTFCMYACEDHILSDCETVSPPEQLRATFQSIQENVFSPTCAKAGCHTEVDPPEGLILTSGKAYSNLVNVQSNQSILNRVEAGDSENSWIIKKLRADGTSGMPPVGRISSAVIDTIAAWINNGAEED
jgi:hypothetical protein